MSLFFRTIRQAARDVHKATIFAAVIYIFNRGGMFMDLTIQATHGFKQAPIEQSSAKYSNADRLAALDHLDEMLKPTFIVGV